MCVVHTSIYMEFPIYTCTWCACAYVECIAVWLQCMLRSAFYIIVHGTVLLYLVLSEERPPSLSWRACFRYIGPISRPVLSMHRGNRHRAPRALGAKRSSQSHVVLFVREVPQKGEVWVKKTVAGRLAISKVRRLQKRAVKTCKVRGILFPCNAALGRRVQGDEEVHGSSGTYSNGARLHTCSTTFGGLGGTR